LLPVTLHSLKDLVRLKDAVAPMTGDLAHHSGIFELFQIFLINTYSLNCKYGVSIFTL